jgi:molecular chaperone DnaK
LSFRLELTRVTFERLSSVLLDEMSEKMMDVVQTAGLEVSDLSVVLPVGGSTRIPMVRERIRKVLGIEPETSVRPDEAVALGAALYAARIQMEQGHGLMIDADARNYLEGLSVTDVSAHSLGVSVFAANGPAGGRSVMQSLLNRNTALPCERSQTFYTMHPNETRIVVPILEGEESDPDLCTRIGEVVIDDLPPGRPSHQPIVVTMEYDRDGILKVAARDEQSGQEVITSIERAGREMAPYADSATDAVRLAVVH